MFPRRRDRFSEVAGYASDSESGRAALLIGPRQVGKTTILLQLADQLLDSGWPPGNITFFDFSDDRLLEPVSPRLVADARAPSVRGDWPRAFLLDEVQEAVAWQKWLKGAVDQERREPSNARSRFIATGSSAGSLRDGAVESGQGRWDEIAIEGLTYREFLLANAVGRDDDERSIDEALGLDPGLFERYLLTGGFPEHARPPIGRSPLPLIRQDIVERAVLRDLRRSGVQIDRVRRLLVHLVNGSGATWNALARAKDLDANRKSVEEWVSLLEGTQLMAALEQDLRPRARARAQLRAQPRLYASDHGLITALSPAADPLGDSETRGRVLEAAVFRHLREVKRQAGGQLTYFRHNDDLEIDFVWRPVRGSPVGIEVTASSDVRGRKLHRLAAAAAATDVKRTMLVYDGLLSHERDETRILPAYEFLRSPLESLEAAHERS